MACYAAGVLLAAFAALVALPLQAQAQTEVWSGTLTVRDLGFSLHGCSNTVSGSHCSSRLTDDDFTHDGTDYAITAIFLRTNGQLEITFDTDLATATQGLTLNVDGTAFAFEDADSKRADARVWFSSGLSWSAGDTVSLTLTDPADAPDKPTGLTATASGMTQIDLEWVAPADNGGAAISGYRIEVSADAGTTWTDLVANTGTTSVTYSHTGLTAGTTRHYRVSAINTNGTGDASDAANATTVPDTTSPSPESAAVATSGTSVTVTFNEGLDSATQIQPAAVVAAFTVTADGVDLNIANILASTTDSLNIRLPTGTAISQNQTVTVSYNKTTAGTDALEDAAANEVASFTDFAVTNNSTVVNSAPTFPSSTANRSVAENTGEDQNVGAVLTATDSDGDTLTYTLEGTDAAAFALDTTTTAGSARIRTKMDVTYNHEAQSTYTVVVKADDGNGGTDTVTVTITVTDVTEPPGSRWHPR